MLVHTFPRCCGAGVLIIESLTGRGEEADMELLKSWVSYARRNGYRMYDFPTEYEGKSGDPMSSKAVLNGPTDKKDWRDKNSWGMLLAMTNPGMGRTVEPRLEKFGFTRVFTTRNPVYSNINHKIHLWALDITTFTEEMLKPKEASVAITPQLQEVK